MDKDMIIQRINIDKLVQSVKKQEPDIKDPHKTAALMIKEFSANIEKMVRDFENGDGDFSACFFDAKNKS